VRASVPTAPPRSASVLPVVQAARVHQAATAAVSASLEGQVATLRQSASQLRDGMADAVLEADRLRQQKSASQAELNGLWSKLAALDARNLFLETEKADSLASQHRILRAQQQVALEEVASVAASSDAELSMLRLQHADMADTIRVQAVAADRQAAQLVASEKRAAVGEFLRRCLMAIFSSVALYVGLRFASQFFPLPKFIP